MKKTTIILFIFAFFANSSLLFAGAIDGEAMTRAILIFLAIIAVNLLLYICVLIRCVIRGEDGRIYLIYFGIQVVASIAALDYTLLFLAIQIIMPIVVIWRVLSGGLEIKWNAKEYFAKRNEKNIAETDELKTDSQ